MARGTKISLFLALTGIALVAWFLFSVFLSGDPLLTANIWQQDKSMSATEVLAWRKNPEAYAAPSLEITPEMNPVSISIAHWSKDVGFPRSSTFTLVVEDSSGRAVLKNEIKLSQGKDEGGSGTVIFEWVSDTPALTLLEDYLEVPEAGTYTFGLRPGERLEGNHSRLQLRLRSQATRPQWWMIIAGFPLVFTAVSIFMVSGFIRMRRVLEQRKA